MNYFQLFSDFCDVLLKHKDQLYEFQFYPEEIDLIKNKNFNNSGKICSYSFRRIKVVLDKGRFPNHTIPEELDFIKIVLSIDNSIEIKTAKDKDVEDLFCCLDSLNIELSSCKGENEYLSSWHLDRHIQGKDEKSPSNLHPMYHLTFGGHHMEKEQKPNSDEFGRSLILRAPRIMHPPMELILGIDFIFNHFIPKDELELLSDPGYLRIIKELKTYIWMPFSLAIAKNYCDGITIDNKPLTFDDSFVSSVLSL